MGSESKKRPREGRKMFLTLPVPRVGQYISLIIADKIGRPSDSLCSQTLYKSTRNVRNFNGKDSTRVSLMIGMVSTQAELFDRIPGIIFLGLVLAAHSLVTLGE